MTTTYVPTIGLEIHAELKTKSKMFCGCVNDPDHETPNDLICPVCMAHPGTLPVINTEAVKQVLRVGVAVNGTLATFTEFDRKNYFYPDIPKNYQISQYKFPLVSGGMLAGVELTRIHLEEDTARSTHGNDESKIDYNRAGVPLMELVTEPVIHDAQTAVRFAKELRLLLQYLGAGEANLEKGEMRIEANISVAQEGGPLGTKVEVKNLNSFKAVEQAIEHEIQRHKKLLEHGEKVIQETRGWNEDSQKTFSQRLKEESHDYRYYPDPDLPKMFLDKLKEFTKENLQASLPVLPWELREQYVELGVHEQAVETLIGDVKLNGFFELIKRDITDTQVLTLAVNYLTSDVLGLMSKSSYDGKQVSDMDAKEFMQLITMVHEGVVSSRGAKDILAVWVRDGGDPKKLAERLEVLQISDTKELEVVIKNILTEHTSVVDEYKSGKESALQFLIGQGMRATKGAANPSVLKELIVKGVKNS